MSKSFDNTPFTEEEILLFKEYVKDMQNGILLPYKQHDRCIAAALCKIGSHRRSPFCGNSVSSVRKILTKMISRDFSEEEMNTIIEYCMNDGDCDESLMSRMEKYVPVLMRRSKTLMDYVNDLEKEK